MKSIENILLLSCRSPYLDSDKVYPPLGNLYLYSIIKRDRPHVQVTVKDDYSLADPSWLNGYDAVGISIMTPQREEASKLLFFIKSKKPEIKVLAGGPHAKYYFNEMKNEPWDVICTHEAERQMGRIIDGDCPRVITDNISVQDFPKVAVKPARLENAEFLRGYNYKLNGRNSTTMFNAKGCPEHCTFCEDAKSMVKWTPLDMTFSEIDDIHSLGYTGVYIFDDIFSIAMNKVRPIAERLKQKDIIYRCNGQARIMTMDFMKMLADTGCYEIAFGAESGSQKILDNIHKRTTIEMNYNFVNWCNEFGIICKAFLMLGLPGENLETIAQTEKFIETSGIKDFQLSIYYPYKGTQIRDAIDRGEEGFDLKFVGEGLGAYGQKGGSTECVVRTKDLSVEDLLYQRDRIVKTYKPHSHANKWADKTSSDHFFDTHLAENKIVDLGYKLGDKYASKK